MSNIISANNLILPDGVYLPFGKSVQYNIFLMDYYITQSIGFNYILTCYNDYVKNTLNYEIFNSETGHRIKDQLGREYDVTWDKNLLKSDLGFIDLSYIEEYMLEVTIQNNSDPLSVQELKSIIYEYFNWKNVNVFAEEVEYVGYSKSGIKFKFHIRLINCLPSEELKELVHVLHLILKNYNAYVESINNYKVKLYEINSQRIIEMYENYSDYSDDGIRSSLLHLLPFKCRFESDKYKESIINYYNNIYYWAKVAIEFGKENNYSDEFFQDLQNSVDNLITEDIMDIIITGRPAKDEQLGIFSDSFSNKSIYQSIIQTMELDGGKVQDNNMQEVGVSKIVEPESQSCKIISGDEVHTDTISLLNKTNRDSDTNISDIENSISNIQIIIDRM